MPIVIIALIIVFGIIMTVLHSKSSMNHLETWAAENGCMLLSYEKRYVRVGPYLFRKGRSQDVYYVTVRMSDGEVRSAYVRIGGAWLGMISDSVLCEWVS